ncbi:MAG: cytosine permease [Kutzneria sp.]|nr:cytosine permease [Kutzneria sp.]
MTDQVEPSTRPGVYGERVAAVEPGGVERIPETERHGSPVQLFWTWASPNLEFATVFIGVLAVGAFGLGFWQTVLALSIGTALGSVTHGVLSARGPGHGVPQMVLGRAAFGFWGNILPAGLMSVTAGIGWFAVNSVSGAFALSALTHLPALGSLVLIVLLQIIVAFFGHNLVHVFERYAFVFLAVVFVVASAVILIRSHPGAAIPSAGVPGAFLLTVASAFGYAAGWNPYASDYARYLPKATNRLATGLWSGLGVFVSCVVLEVVGAASVTAGVAGSDNPTEAFTGQLPTVVAGLTLVAIALGAVAANVLNIYSGAMSFLAMGITLSAKFRRALVAVVFGTAGFFVAWLGLDDAGQKYENFLLVIAYWIAPWLGVFFTDQYLRRRTRIDDLLYDRRYRNGAGPVAMAVGIVVSVALFGNQTDYVGIVPRLVPDIGDVTFLVGFAVAGAVYATLRRPPRADVAAAELGANTPRHT